MWRASGTGAQHTAHSRRLTVCVLWVCTNELYAVDISHGWHFTLSPWVQCNQLSQMTSHTHLISDRSGDVCSAVTSQLLLDQEVDGLRWSSILNVVNKSLVEFDESHAVRVTSYECRHVCVCCQLLSHPTRHSTCLHSQSLDSNHWGSGDPDLPKIWTDP